MTKRRQYETLGRRILRLLSPEFGGPRKRTVLIGLAGSEKRLQRTLARLMAAGQVVMLGSKRGTLYGLGRQR
jgi:hypothetical protein